MSRGGPSWLTPLMLALVVIGCTIAWLISPASAALPGTKWGTQLDLGTVGNSTVIRVTDETLTCLILQPKNFTASPAVTCWGAP